MCPVRPVLQEARRAPTKQVPSAAQAKGKGKKGGAAQARWGHVCVLVLVGFRADAFGRTLDAAQA